MSRRGLCNTNQRLSLSSVPLGLPLNQRLSRVPNTCILCSFPAIKSLHAVSSQSLAAGLQSKAGSAPPTLGRYDGKADTPCGVQCNLYTAQLRYRGTRVRPISLPVGPQQPSWPSFGQNGGFRCADQHHCQPSPGVQSRPHTPTTTPFPHADGLGDGSDRYGDARPPIHLPSSRSGDPYPVFAFYRRLSCAPLGLACCFALVQ